MTNINETVLGDRDFEVARHKLYNEMVVDLWPETGLLLRRSRNAVYKAAKDGSIPVIRIGRSLMVPTAPLRKMLGLDEEPATTRLSGDAMSGLAALINAMATREFPAANAAEFVKTIDYP